MVGKGELTIEAVGAADRDIVEGENRLGGG
jgi:hypothetical protein